MFCRVCRWLLASAVLASTTLAVWTETPANDNIQLPAGSRASDGRNDNILRLPAEAVKNHGTLIIVGGGCTPPEAKREFVRLAGGPQARIVIVPRPVI